MQDRATISEMDQVISFLSVDQSIDASGGAVSSSAPFAGQGSRVLWAKVTREQGSEVSEADIPTALARAKAELRFVDGINKNMRVVWQDFEWEITDLDAQPRHDRLIIFLARRGSSGGGDPR